MKVQKHRCTDWALYLIPANFNPNISERSALSISSLYAFTLFKPDSSDSLSNATAHNGVLKDLRMLCGLRRTDYSPGWELTSAGRANSRSTPVVNIAPSNIWSVTRLESDATNATKLEPTRRGRCLRCADDGNFIAAGWLGRMR
jgi:hypothetical protein